MCSCVGVMTYSHVGVSARLGCWKCLKLHSPLLPRPSDSQGNSIGRSFQISCCSHSPDPFHGTFCEVCTKLVARQPNSPVGPPLNQLRFWNQSNCSSSFSINSIQSPPFSFSLFCLWKNTTPHVITAFGRRLGI